MKITKGRFFFQFIGMFMTLSVVAFDIECLVSPFGNKCNSTGKIKRIFFTLTQVYLPIAFAILPRKPDGVLGH